MSDLHERARRLNVHGEQESLLLSFLRDASTGMDISDAAESIARYCLRREAVSVLTLAMDALLVSPGHESWAAVLDVMVDVLGEEISEKNEEDLVAVVLSKVPQVPFVVARAVVAGMSSGIVQRGTASSLRIRCLAIEAASSLCLRDRPLTELPDRHSPILRDLTPGEDEATRHCAVRKGIELLVEFLIQSMMESKASDVASLAFISVVDFASSAFPKTGQPNLFAKEALAHVLLGRLIRDMPKILRGISGVEGASKVRTELRMAKFASMALRYGRELRSSSGPDQEMMEKASHWAQGWIEKELVPRVSSSETKEKMVYCRGLLYVASVVDQGEHLDRRMKWGCAAVVNMIK